MSQPHPESRQKELCDMTAGFSIVSAFMVAALMILTMKRYLPDRGDLKSGIGGYALIFLLSGILGASGVLADFNSMPPRFFFFIAALLVASFVVASSPWGGRVVHHVPLRVLVGLQGFRILPEVLLDLAFREGLAPIQMTWHGRNLDILTAVTALLVAGFWNRLPHAKRWAWAQSILGLALLINIVSVAVLSAPLPFRIFMNEPANTFVVYFPYIWLPGIHVLTALTLHGLTLRRLMKGGA
jgi:hypothetical protein